MTEVFERNAREVRKILDRMPKPIRDVFDPPSPPTVPASYTLTPARYAKKSVAVRPLDNHGDSKGRSARLCGALNARWSNRERAYVMSESKGRKFEELFAVGADAHLVFDSIYSSRYVLDGVE